jgi:hypothetical protein
MSHDDHYQGFDIDITLLPIHGDQFQPQIKITRHAGANVITRQFSNDQHFDREEDAIRHGLITGRAIIDGQVEGCSVADWQDDIG